MSNEELQFRSLFKITPGCEDEDAKIAFFNRLYQNYRANTNAFLDALNQNKDSFDRYVTNTDLFFCFHMVFRRQHAAIIEFILTKPDEFKRLINNLGDIARLLDSEKLAQLRPNNSTLLMPRANSSPKEFYDHVFSFFDEHPDEFLRLIENDSELLNLHPDEWTGFDKTANTMSTTKLSSIGLSLLFKRWDCASLLQKFLEHLPHFLTKHPKLLTRFTSQETLCELLKKLNDRDRALIIKLIIDDPDNFNKLIRTREDLVNLYQLTNSAAQKAALIDCVLTPERLIDFVKNYDDFSEIVQINGKNTYEARFFQYVIDNQTEYDRIVLDSANEHDFLQLHENYKQQVKENNLKHVSKLLENVLMSMNLGRLSSPISLDTVIPILHQLLPKYLAKQLIEQIPEIDYTVIETGEKDQIQKLLFDLTVALVITLIAATEQNHNIFGLQTENREAALDDRINRFVTMIKNLKINMIPILNHLVEKLAAAPRSRQIEQYKLMDNMIQEHKKNAVERSQCKAQHTPGVFNQADVELMDDSVPTAQPTRLSHKRKREEKVAATPQVKRMNTRSSGLFNQNENQMSDDDSATSKATPKLLKN